MAPALTDSSGKPTFVTDSAEESDGSYQLAKNKDSARSKNRRVFSSVDNISPHMEDHNMGLQSAANLLKDSQEMEQILGDLGGGSDLGQVDILQVIKTMEGGGDTLSTGEADAIFPLSGFERDFLADTDATVEAESDAGEEKARALQIRLERRCAFLRRRLRMQQARVLGKQVAEEVAGTFDRVGRMSRRESGSQRPTGVKALLKKIETTASFQASAAVKPKSGPRYLRTNLDATSPVLRTSTLGLPSGSLTGLERAAGMLRTELGIVEKQLDSDATASSSGAESNDEAVNYNNLHQQPMQMEKRALWIWSKQRASIASRWTWLQAQVQELEYKIRQHTDLQRQVRSSKGVIQFIGEPRGYTGPLPGDSVQTQVDEQEVESCSRTRPLDRSVFRKRKLLQMHNLHTAATKAAKPADIRCGCQWPVTGCAVCTGRAVATQPLPPSCTLAPRERLALVDPGYHPVLSDINDVSPSIHYAAIAKNPSWQQKVARSSIKNLRNSLAGSGFGKAGLPPLKKGGAFGGSGGGSGVGVASGGAMGSAGVGAEHYGSGMFKKRKYNKMKRGRPSLNKRPRDLLDDGMSADSSPVPSPHSNNHDRTRGRDRERQRLNSSYDIDNIVIPHSIAANTRLEILQYKEILTPKWRVMDVGEDGTTPTSTVPTTTTTNNGILPKKPSIEEIIEKGSDTEDISDACVLARHQRCEEDERGKYHLNKHKKSQQRKNSAHTSTPPHENNSDHQLFTREMDHLPLAADKEDSLPTTIAATVEESSTSPLAPTSPVMAAQVATKRRSTLLLNMEEAGEASIDSETIFTACVPPYGGYLREDVEIDAGESSSELSAASLD